MSTTAPSYPSECILKGHAIAPFTLRTGLSAKGKAYQLVTGKVISGETFVNVTQSVPAGSVPFLPQKGDEVRAVVVPNFKDDGVLSLDVQLLKPDEMAIPAIVKK